MISLGLELSTVVPEPGRLKDRFSWIPEEQDGRLLHTQEEGSFPGQPAKLQELLQPSPVRAPMLVGNHEPTRGGAGQFLSAAGRSLPGSGRTTRSYHSQGLEKWATA